MFSICESTGIFMAQAIRIPAFSITDGEWFASVKQYEKEVLSKRG